MLAPRLVADLTEPSGASRASVYEVTDGPDFTAFVAARYPALVRSAYLLVGDRGRAEDLVQSALYRCYRRWGQLRMPEAAEAYVRTTMVRLASRWGRRRWRGEHPSDLSACDKPARTGVDPDSVIDTARALATLSPAQRAVLVLRYFDDLSEARTAELLGCSVKSMWAHETHPSLSSLSIAAGVDPYLLDTSAGRWQVSSFVPAGEQEVYGPLWTGREIVVPTTGIWCGMCPHQVQLDATGVRFDPRTATSATVSHGPASEPGNRFVWTGAALLGIGGAPAAWSPATNTWTRLAKAPVGTENQPVMVWTGSSLLVWGPTFTLAGTGRTESAGTGGLRFGPPQ